MSVIKGSIFVILTSILLFLFLRWNERKLMSTNLRINDLNMELQNREIAAQLARLESIGHLAAGMAHNLNNALTVIEGNLAVIKDQTKGPDQSARNMEALEDAVDRVKGLSHTLVTFSEGGEPIKETTDLRKFIPEATNFTLGSSNVNVTFDLPTGLAAVQADRGQLRPVLDAIVVNAVEALPGGGELRISGRNVILREKEIADLKAGEYVRIDIYNPGPAIPKQDLAHIFDPYYSTKGPARGLGLTLVQNIVRRHQGLVTVSSIADRGTTFSIFLPSHTDLPEQFIEVKRKTVNERKILWMDDEEGIREVGKELLQFLGYQADMAANGEEALDMYRSSLKDDPYSAVILDLIVPGGMGGAQTMENLMKIDPQVRAVVCSGYSNDPIMAHHQEHGFLAVLPKPFKLESLEKILSDLLNE